MNSSVAQSGHSDTRTEGVRIRVGAAFAAGDSEPGRGLYFFVYRVIITNEGQEKVKLLSRYWRICDANHEVQEVLGDGVVGEQPELNPGESFEYSSGCPLSTSWGTMEGHYVMERPSGETFTARIGRFFLAPNTAALSTL
ncbi:MAG TPA: Co2+/Mg2+ efflux protein ApaG [Planctomycetota bacterium]|jgi:ApaG protein|nr:Co2+/Mg2+ efflux protein ApaG [Planctomycetota bacterium]